MNEVLETIFRHVLQLIAYLFVLTVILLSLWRWFILKYLKVRKLHREFCNFLAQRNGCHPTSLLAKDYEDPESLLKNE